VTLDDATRDHDRCLRTLLDRCREKGIRLSKYKMKINRTSLKFMGHELTKDGLKPDKYKTEAITNIPPPTDRQGAMRLLGMATYLARFVLALSDTVASIRELLRRDAEFRWEPTVHGRAFDKLKALLATEPVLIYYDVTKPVVVQARHRHSRESVWCFCKMDFLWSMGQEL